VRLLWPIIKDTAIYFWEELFYLVIFNLLTVISLAPGVYILWTSPQMEPAPPPVVYVPISILLCSALPYTLFSLFWTVYEISEGKAIKFHTFFGGGKQLLKHAYIWWGINLVVLIILVVNISFYSGLQTGWSVYASMFFIGLLVAWLLTQAFALTMYPRLIEPGFKMATKNAMVIVAKQTIPVLFAGIL